MELKLNAMELKEIICYSKLILNVNRPNEFHEKKDKFVNQNIKPNVSNFNSSNTHEMITTFFSRTDDSYKEKLFKEWAKAKKKDSRSFITAIMYGRKFSSDQFSVKALKEDSKTVLALVSSNLNNENTIDGLQDFRIKYQQLFPFCYWYENKMTYNNGREIDKFYKGLFKKFNSRDTSRRVECVLLKYTNWNCVDLAGPALLKVLKKLIKSDPGLVNRRLENVEYYNQHTPLEVLIKEGGDIVLPKSVIPFGSCSSCADEDCVDPYCGRKDSPDHYENQIKEMKFKKMKKITSLFFKHGANFDSSTLIYMINKNNDKAIQKQLERFCSMNGANFDNSIVSYMINKNNDKAIEKQLERLSSMKRLAGLKESAFSHYVPYIKNGSIVPISIQILYKKALIQHRLGRFTKKCAELFNPEHYANQK